MIDSDLKNMRRRQFEDGLLPDRAFEESTAQMSQSELDEVGLEFQFFSENRALTELECAEGLYFEPSFAESLQFLFRRVGLFVDRALRQAYLHGVTDPRAKIASLLEQEVERWIRVEERLIQSGFYCENGFLKTRFDFKRQTLGFPQVRVRQMRLEETRQSTSLFVRELPRWAEQWRARKSLAVSTSAPISVLAKEGLRVTHGGHAFLAVATPTSFVLVDPVFWPNRSDFRIPPFNSRNIGKPTAVFLTHGHSDHLNLQYLLELDPETPVYIPGVSPRWHGAPLEWILRDIGLKNINVVVPGQSLSFSDDLEVEVFDFFGEARSIVSFPGVVYGFRRRGCGVLCLADTSPDSERQNLLDNSIFRNSVKSNGPYQVMMSTWWQEIRHFFEVSPLSLLRDDVKIQDWLLPTEFCKTSPEFLRSLASFAGARHVGLYAESGWQLFLPPGEDDEYIAAQTLFWQKQHEFGSALGPIGCGLSKARPHDWWEVLRSGDVLASGDVRSSGDASSSS